MHRTIPTILLAFNLTVAFPAFSQAAEFSPDYVLDVQEVNGRAQYNGVFPGPVIRVSPGESFDVELINSLPALNDDCVADVNQPHGFNTTNLHTHGLHVSPSMDSSGQFFADNVFVALVPEDQNTDCAHLGQGAHANFIKGSAQYRFELPEDHMAGTFWYHAHKHGSTATQVADGLAGPLIVENPAGSLPAYIEEAKEKVFVIGDEGLYLAREEGGGQLNPTIEIAPGEVQRWRIINATSEAGEEFHLPRLSLKGLDVFLIAFDGFTLDKRVPITLENIDAPWMNPAALASGNRLDLIVRAPADYTPLPNDDPRPRQSWLSTLLGGEPLAVILDMNVEIAGETLQMAWSDTDTLPSSGLQPFDKQPLPTRSITFTEDETIDGQSYTGNVEQTMTLGTEEEWTVQNQTDELHIYHIHVNPFFVTHLNGEELPTDSPLRRWQDTIGTALNGGSVTFRTRFEQFDGTFVIHCHVLEHEDEGMMQIVEVVTQ